jgi:hypothetical protein
MTRNQRERIVVILLILGFGAFAGAADSRACTNDIQGGAVVIAFDNSTEGLEEVFFKQPVCRPAALIVTAAGLHDLAENATGHVVDGQTGEVGLLLPDPYTGEIRVYWVLIPVEE